MSGMSVRLPELSRRQANFLGFAACAAMMGYALFVQYGEHLVPCNLCILQRMATIGIGLLFLVAALHSPVGWGARIYGALLALASLAGAGTSIRHLWVQAQPPGSIPPCGAPLEYLLKVFPMREALAKIFAGDPECQRVVWQLFGLSMPGWVMLCFIALGIWGVCFNFRISRP
ncbi:MAG TPA: disulfide bond formation protein B [Steroidobacteraceae bacterium]